MTSAVDRFVHAMQHASFGEINPFAEDAVFDATVPNWRFVVRGGEAVGRELSRWFDHPGTFDELRRTPLPDGELVECTLAWTEDGVTHKTHQLHRLTIRGAAIVEDTAWCGGRWPAPLLAEMRLA